MKDDEGICYDLLPVAGDKKIKEEKGLKVLTPSKLVSRLPVLLAQIKAGNNSYKLKNEIRQMLYLLCQHSKITEGNFNNLINSL